MLEITHLVGKKIHAISDIFAMYLLEELQAVLAEKSIVNLFHVNKEPKEVTDTLAHCADVLLLGVKPLYCVLGRVQGSQGASSLFF